MNREYVLILITGFPRSGTTWIGEQVVKRYDLDYIFEPFSVRYHTKSKEALHLRNLISNFLDKTYYHHGWYYPDNYRVNDQKIFQSHVSVLRDKYSLKKPVLVIKQPFSVKLNWALQALKPNYVYWIDRHPAGILASYIKRNALQSWSQKEYEVFKEYYCSGKIEIGDQFFHGCKKPVKNFFTLFHEGRKKAMEALKNYGCFKEIIYENACQNIEKELIFFNELANRRESLLELNENYKLNKPHLDTNQNSEKKLNEWHSKLNRNILEGMKNYFEYFGLYNYQKEMPDSIPARLWWNKLK